MNIDSLINFFFSLKNEENKQKNLKKCKVLDINEDMSLRIKYDDNIYNLYLKDVPRKRYLSNNLKILCQGKYLFLEIIENNINFNTKKIIGILYNSSNKNINEILIQRFKYFQNKFINERYKLCKKQRKFWYLNNKKLSIIYEEEGEGYN